jgi:hypothetical protein
MRGEQMILGFSDPVSRWIVLSVLLATAAWILALAWFVFRAVCRRLHVRPRTQAVIAIAFVLFLCAAAFEIWRDKLSALEQVCKNEFMKSDRLAAASELEIKKHVDGWNKGWSTMWGYTEPFVDPLVWLWISFIRDGEKHHMQVKCRFTKIPGSGEPPQLRFDKLETLEPSFP